MFDTSSTSSFIKKAIEFKWGLLERIRCNSEDWDIDKDKESGINLKFDCVNFFYENRCFS